MRRHASLIPLTHDHHHGLAQARRMKLAAEAGDPQTRLDRALEFLDYFGREALHHFRAEEEAIFPLLLDYFDERPELLVRTLLQHLKIHSCTTRLREEVDACAVNEDTLRELAELLEAHIRLEEKELFPLIEEVVPVKALNKAGLKLVPRGIAQSQPPALHGVPAGARTRSERRGTDTSMNPSPRPM